MASLYGGKKGQDFYPARIFENKVTADANIASVNYNDIILIDYGFINSDNYTENLKTDGGINYSGTFWQKNYNTTNSTAEYKYLSALKFDVTKKIEFLPIVYRTEDNFNLEAYNNLLENQIQPVDILTIEEEYITSYWCYKDINGEVSCQQVAKTRDYNYTANYVTVLRPGSTALSGGNWSPPSGMESTYFQIVSLEKHFNNSAINLGHCIPKISLFSFTDYNIEPFDDLYPFDENEKQIYGGFEKYLDERIDYLKLLNVDFNENDYTLTFYASTAIQNPLGILITL